MGQQPDGRASWIVVGMEPMPNGDLEVTYSLAPSYRYIAQVRPRDDAALAIRTMGEYLFSQYNERGYV